MDFEEMLKKFEFLFEESNDVKRDIILAKENVDIQVEKEKYAEIALRYIRENVSKMPPITLLTNLGLLSLVESLKLIQYPRRINQYEIDFTMAMVLKYGVMKMNYDMECGEIQIEHLLKAISIYIFCLNHKLHKDSIEAKKINAFYRMNRIIGFDEEKAIIIKEFCEEYDKKTKDEQIKLSRVLQFFFRLKDYWLGVWKAYQGK